MQAAGLGWCCRAQSVSVSGWRSRRPSRRAPLRFAGRAIDCPYVVSPARSMVSEARPGTEGRPRPRERGRAQEAGTDPARPGPAGKDSELPRFSDRRIQKSIPIAPPGQVQRLSDEPARPRAGTPLIRLPANHRTKRVPKPKPARDAKQDAEPDAGKRLTALTVRQGTPEP